MFNSKNLSPGEEIIESDIENLEDAIEIAKMNLPEGSQIWLVAEDPSGAEHLIPVEVEKKDEN